jgi:hypothetical protein
MTDEEYKKLPVSQKMIMFQHIMQAIPSSPKLLKQVIPYVRMAISELSGPNIDDAEVTRLFGRMKKHGWVSFDETHIRRLT